MAHTLSHQSPGGSHFEPPRNTPTAVRRWYDIHVREGIHGHLAFYRALERAAAEGELSETAFSRLEAVLRGSNGRLDLDGPPEARLSH